MWEFATLLSEGEFEEWLVQTVFGGKETALDRVLEGFKCINIGAFFMTFETREQAEELLSIMEGHGSLGVLWPGLGSIVRVKASSMDETVTEITVIDVDTETDEDLVRRALEKFGKIKRCERSCMPGSR